MCMWKMDEISSDSRYDLPLEILHQIAQIGELVYRALLAIPAFARSMTIGKILDYMELFGHDVKIMIYDDGDKCIEWTRKNQPHRLNGPAKIYKNGDECWYQNGQLHRLDGPAVIYPSGEQYWYKNHELHRLDGPAAISANGTQCWYLNGKRHRLNGPAITYADGSVEYWERGRYYDHR